MDQRTMKIAQIIPATEAEGPGRRFALWFQGCPLRCPGCCNLEMLPFAGGMAIFVADVVSQLRDARERHALEGITLLGGEPFAHADAALALARAAHRLDLSVMIFTGYEIEELRENTDKTIHLLLNETDILVDGPYRREEPETKRRWIGSANQSVHFLSERCSPSDPRWLLPNTLEIRLHDGEVTVNGFPAPSAVGLWKRVG
ncbi:MAG: radical SAM protein [Planctomycetes bacterium]|nr:radical SAM protein [Planctomycetota bacterium]